MTAINVTNSNYSVIIDDVVTMVIPRSKCLLENLQSKGRIIIVGSSIECTFNSDVLVNGVGYDSIEDIITTLRDFTDNNSSDMNWEEIENKPVGNTRQVLGFNEEQEIVPTTIGWEHLSDLESPPIYEMSVLGLKNVPEEDMELGFVEVSTVPKANSIPLYRLGGEGQLSVSNPELEEDAVNLRTLNSKLDKVVYQKLTANGNDTSTIEFAHGLTDTPSLVSAVGLNSISAVKFVTYNTTTIFINGYEAFPEGENNVEFAITIVKA